MQNKNVIDTSSRYGVDRNIERSIALSMKRLATVFGNIDEISEDEKSMVMEMSRLKKYDKIREIIKSRNGFVNVVTRGGYQPLIEQIILSAIPAGAGGIYNAGMESVIPGDYDIDAERVFGNVKATPAEQAAAVGKFTNLVLGSPPPITPKTFQDRSWTKEKLMMTFGKTRAIPPSLEDDKGIPPTPIWPIIEQFFTYYDQIQAKIERPASENDTTENPGIFKRDMMSDYDFIIQDTLARNKNVVITKRNKANEGVVGYTPIPLEPTLSPENLRTLKLKFIDNRNQYLRYKKEAVNLALQQLVTPPPKRGTETQLAPLKPELVQEVLPVIRSLLAGKMIGDAENVFGKGIREGGFIGTKEDTAAKLASLRQECSVAFRKTQAIANQVIDPAEKGRQTNESRKEEKKRLFDLYDYIYNIKTTNEKVATLKEEILKQFVETKTVNGVEETVWPDKADDINPVAIVYKFNDMSKDIAELTDTMGKTENRVLIVSNVDSSSLVSPIEGGHPDGEKNKAAIISTLDAFGIALSRSSTPKTLVLISKEPLGGMNYSKDKYDRKQFIDFSDYPVDAEEAKIIVKHVLDNDYGKRFKSTWLKKRNEEIEIKRLAKIREIESAPGTNAANAKRALKERIAIEKENLSAHVIGAYEMTLPREEQLNEAEIMLVGLEQQSAIGLVKECVEVAAKQTMVEKAGVERVDSLGFDLEAWNKNLIERGNSLHQDNVPGLSKRRSRVRFDDYIFAKTSATGDATDLKWGLKVGEFGAKHQEMMTYNKVISDIMNDASGEQAAMRAIIEDPQSDAWERKQAELSLANIRGSLKDAVQKKSAVLGSLPHLILLYGKSGVGKTVWADALADLFGFSIMSVDFGGAKDKWLGNTEKFTDRIISVVKNSRNAVVLIDEMDRDVSGGGSQQGGEGHKSGGHQVDQAITKKLMALFEDDKDKLVENNVFVLITTNYVKDFDPALVKRSENNVYRVVAPTDPKDYEQYMKSFLETEKRYMPNDPWLNSIKSESPSLLSEYSSLKDIEAVSSGKGGHSISDYWKEVENLLRSIPMDSFCKIMAQKRLAFRTICSMMRRAITQHALYETTKLRFQRGTTTEIQGMPFTFENIVRAASVAHEDPDDLTKDTDGIGETAAELNTRANSALKKMMAEGGLKKSPMITVIEGKPYTPEQVFKMIESKQVRLFRTGMVGYNWGNNVFKDKELIAIAQTDYSGNIIMGTFLPDEIDKMMVHEMLPEEEENIDTQQYSIEESELGGRTFTRMKPKPPSQPPSQPPVGKTMEDLVNSGMVDRTPTVEDSLPQGQKTEVTPHTVPSKPAKTPRKIEETPHSSKKTDTEKTSTTDYYYDFLMKMGVINKIAQYQQQMSPEQKPAILETGVSPNTATVPGQQIATPPEPQWFDDVEQYGVYYYQEGQAIVMPAGPEEKPQYLSETKGRPTR